MGTASHTMTTATAVKIGLVVVPLFTTAAVALYRVDQAETRIEVVASDLDAEREARDQAMDRIEVGQREVLDNIVDIKIKVGVLCQAVDGARCP